MTVVGGLGFKATGKERHAGEQIIICKAVLLVGQRGKKFVREGTKKYAFRHTN
jgi:hypothetical protein